MSAEEKYILYLYEEIRAMALSLMPGTNSKPLQVFLFFVVSDKASMQKCKALALRRIALETNLF